MKKDNREELKEWFILFLCVFALVYCVYGLITEKQTCKLEYTGPEVCVEWEGGSPYRSEIVLINLNPKLVTLPNKCLRKEKKERLVCYTRWFAK